MFSSKLKSCLVAFTMLMAVNQSSDAGVRTSVSEIGDYVYVTQVTTDQFGNSFSQSQRFPKQVYYAEIQRQQYVRWYNSLPYAQRMTIDAQKNMQNAENQFYRMNAPRF